MESESFFTMSATHKLIKYFFYCYAQFFLYKFYTASITFHLVYPPVGRAVAPSFLVREVWGSIFISVKSNTVLPTARHRCDISSNEAVLPGRNDAEMGPVNLFNALA